MLKPLRNIIVIDDDYISLFLITKILGEQRLTETILPFTNGISALEYLSKSAQDICKLPDVILLDIKMPEISGWQFLQQLKNINFTDDYKPFVCTISADISIDTEMLKNEPLIKAHLVKPIIPAKLAALLTCAEMEFEAFRAIEKV
jgi:CheY-like chemotaxis protein